MILTYVESASGAEYLAKEKRELALELMNAATGGESRNGRPPLAVLPAYCAQNLPLPEVERSLRERDGERLLAAHPMEWGYCLLPRGSQHLTPCSGDPRSPLGIQSCPDECGRCPHLATGPEHLALWQQLAILHQDIVKSPLTVPLAKAASARMVKSANQVVRAIQSHSSWPDTGAGMDVDGRQA